MNIKRYAQQLSKHHFQRDDVAFCGVRIGVSGTLRNLAFASIIYVTGLLLLALLRYSELFNDQFTLTGLHVVAGLAFYSYWKREPWGSARYDCFGAAILLLSIGFRVLSAFGTMFYGTGFDFWPTTVMVDSDLLSLYFKGEALTFFGVLLMVATWRLTVRDKIERFTFLRGDASSNNLHFKVLYGLAVFSHLLARAGGVDFGAWAQLIQVIQMGGVASIYFLACSNVKTKPSAWVIKALFLAVPISVVALTVGMKENLFQPFVPAAIIAWLAFSNLYARIGMVLLGIIVLSIAQIYVGYVRQNAWEDVSKSYSANELAAGALGDMDEDSFVRGMMSMLSRMNPSMSHAIGVALAERDGFMPMEIFGDIPANFIPRLFWPNKPIVRPGAMHTQRIRGTSQNIENVNSASTPGFFVEMYMGGGVIALIVFSVFYGYALGRIQLSIFTKLPLSATFVSSLLMFYSAIRIDERSLVYALTGMVLSYVFVLFIFKVLEIMPLARQRR